MILKISFNQQKKANPVVVQHNVGYAVQSLKYCISKTYCRLNNKKFNIFPIEQLKINCY